MKTIAIASGKGGTGKTSLSVALLQAHQGDIRLLDCDVEEPNCHLFLDPQKVNEFGAELLIPKIDTKKCRLCGDCVEACQFNALALAGNQIILFQELCHGCGACTLACPHDAIEEIPTNIGQIVQARTESGVEVVKGTLKVGHASAPTVIAAVKNTTPLQKVKYQIIDAPAGTSCSFAEAVKGADFVILVTEPTPFGLNDLDLAIEALHKMKLPFGVVINRVREKENLITEYCAKNNYRVLLEIPESRKVAEYYSQGKSLIDAKPELEEALKKLLDDL
ncbi:MAG: 4Fe-4S binding protein [Fibrobacter sp.]|nr:4Fe-4S binding protein [Fibrobacter sp.]